MNTQRPVVRGISLDAQGQATIDSAMNDVLFDFALQLEELTQLPVDVQHVVAALVLAARRGEVAATQTVSASDAILVSQLAIHVKSVFAVYGGELGNDDS